MNDWIIPNAAPVVTRESHPPCRCGWVDSTPLGIPPVRVPVVDLTGADGHVTFENSPTGRTCKPCGHPIHPGRAAVVWRLRYGSGVLHRYHPECVEIGQHDD